MLRRQGKGGRMLLRRIVLLPLVVVLRAAGCGGRDEGDSQPYSGLIEPETGS